MDKRTEAQKLAKEMRGKIARHMYRHFKGGIYRVIDIAVHSETAELLVVYAGLDDNTHCTQTWVRPLDMFLSDVDHEKYPDVKQEKRFEMII